MHRRLNKLCRRPLGRGSLGRRPAPVKAAFGLLLFTSLACWSGLPVRGAQEAPTVEDIINRAVERSKTVELQGKSKHYTYSRVSVVEDVGDEGKVEDRREKSYVMIPVSGRIYQRLILANGKPLSEKEQKLEDEKERKFRQSLAQSQPAKMSDKQRIILGRELVSRFRFALAGREIVAGRPTFVLSFVAKSGAAEKKIDDRVLNRLAGKLWIDEEEFEMARIDFHLTEKVSIGWGGVLASVQKFAFTLTRIRLADGVWFNHLFRGDIEGRKILGTLRLRIQDRASDFKQLSTGAVPAALP